MFVYQPTYRGKTHIVSIVWLQIYFISFLFASRCCFQYIEAGTFYWFRNPLGIHREYSTNMELLLEQKQNI